MITAKRAEIIAEEYQKMLAHNLSSYENWEHSVWDLNLPKENTVWLLEFYKVIFLKQEPSHEFLQAMIDDD